MTSTKETVARYEFWIEEMKSKKENCMLEVDFFDKEIARYESYIKELEGEAV